MEFYCAKVRNPFTDTGSAPPDWGCPGEDSNFKGAVLEVPVYGTEACCGTQVDSFGDAAES